MTLSALFLHGVDPVEVAISEGLYSQGAALLKQEMETIEAIHEFEQGSRRDGRTPRINRLKQFGRIYGQYNEFAHVSVDEVARQIVQTEKGEYSGPSLEPIYSADLAFGFYGMHVYLIIEMTGQIDRLMKEIYGEGLSKEEIEYLLISLAILEKMDVIKKAPDT